MFTLFDLLEIFGLRRKRRYRALLNAMSGPISIRNLTTEPFTVKVAERFEVALKPRPNEAYEQQREAPEQQSLGGLFNLVKRNVTEAVQNVTTTINCDPVSLRDDLTDGAQSFAKQEVDIRIDPFATVQTQINAKDRGQDNEVLRLELEGDAARWVVEVPSSSTATQVIKHIGGERNHQYSAIFVPQCTLVVIIDSTDPHGWMGRLHDDTPLSALSIPGTHNSPTCYKALPSVRCQVTEPRTQLDNGVRFLDVRVQVVNPDDPNSDRLQLVHGNFPISLSGSKDFRTLFDDLVSFLSLNRSETVVVSLKREGSGSGTDQQLSLILRDHYIAPAGDKWFIESRVPRLGEARGKVVLLRRFALDDQVTSSHPSGFGLDGANWAYNTTDNTCGNVRVQDFCEVDDSQTDKNISRKIDVCCAHFERAGDCPPSEENGGRLFLNFLSASNFWKTDCWPDKIAARLNPAATAFLCEKHGCEGQGAGAVGIVVCDWVGDKGDWDLVRCIVGMNSRLILAQQQQK